MGSSIQGSRSQSNSTEKRRKLVVTKIQKKVIANLKVTNRERMKVKSLERMMVSLEKMRESLVRKRANLEKE